MRPVESVDPRNPRNPRERYERPARAVQPAEPSAPARQVDTDPDRVYAPSWRGWRLAQIVYTVAGIIEVLLLLRILLELLAANPGGAFSSLIYAITDPLVAPFQGVFPTPHTNGSVLDVVAVLAIVVYALLAWGIARLLELTQRRRPTAAS
jgi:uncharacterized protein YggT (Ycf19 family)